MVIVERLEKAFLDGGARHLVLHDLSLTVERGAFLALVGRSGSGKSTLLNCLAGIERPDGGRIRIGGAEITALADGALTRLRRDRIGIVFQFFNLLPMLSVRDNVALPALLRGDSHRDAHRRALALLEELELGHRASERPDRLSGGEQQRVATARALVNGPDVLLADEPTGNLDQETAARTLQLLRDVNTRHGVTIIMVTHSREAAEAAGRVARLADGRIEPESSAPAARDVRSP